MTPQLHLLQIHPVITPNTKLKIHKLLRNTILITGDSIISGIDEKELSKKHPVKVRPFHGASVDDMHHYLQALLQKYNCSTIIDTIISHVGANKYVSESSRVVLDKIFNL